MGSSISAKQLMAIDSSQWSTVSQGPRGQIVTSRKGLGQGEVNIIPLDPRHEVDKEYQIYLYRKKTQYPLVKAIGAQLLDSDSKTMCGNQKNFKVITQRIPKRLNEFNNLDFPESLYVLNEALQGFEHLHSKTGQFEITDRMIGINENGQLKVWLNENFAHNHPDFEKPILQTSLTNEGMMIGDVSQKKMVQQIIKLIQSKTQKGALPQDFILTLKNQTTFQNAITYINNFINKNNIPLPSTLSLQPKSRNFQHSQYTPPPQSQYTPPPQPQYIHQPFHPQPLHPNFNHPPTITYTPPPQTVYQPGLIMPPIERTHSLYLPQNGYQSHRF